MVTAHITLAGAGIRVRRGGLIVREWAVRNFKSLEYVNLALAPLTLLTGANSSGKSSLIQSLLMLAQSTEDEVILNGTLVRLGEPTDVLRSGTDELQISLTASASHHVRASSEDEVPQEWSFELSLVPHGSTFKVSAFYAARDGVSMLEATSSRVTAHARAEVDADALFGDSLLRVRELDGRRAPARTYVSFRGLHPEALLFRRQPQKLLASLKRNFNSAALRSDPEKALQLYEYLVPLLRSDNATLRLTEEVRERLVTALRGDFGRAGFLLELDQVDLESIFLAVASSSGESEWIPVPVSRYSWGYYNRPLGLRATTMDILDERSDSMRGLAIADDALRGVRDSIRYLGPLREEPQVLSATGGRNRSVPAGSKGEYTADLLARSKNEKVSFFDWAGDKHNLKLPEAVSLWTTYLGVGETVAVEDQGKLGRGLRIKLNGVERDLTTVGVGASQLLPVLTVVLAANSGSLILLEQPELHLHPAVQSRLADFFLSARPDVRIVVETHSEYLVTRLRRRVAESQADPEQVSIMFAEQHEGVTHTRRLRLNSVGDLSDWPTGFFDTQDAEARALVKAVTANIQKKSRDV